MMLKKDGTENSSFENNQNLLVGILNIFSTCNTFSKTYDASLQSDQLL